MPWGRLAGPVSWGRMSRWTRELRRRSPEPVKPVPCMKAAKPMPRLIWDVLFEAAKRVRLA